MMASCIGKLTTSNPAKYLPLLQSQLQSSSADIRATVASAVRYTFTDTAASYDDILAPLIVEFLSLMHDKDLVSLPSCDWNVCADLILAHLS